MQTYFVYMLLCSDGSYYTGITNDAEKRVSEHNAGVDIHCYTFTRRPARLVYVQDFNDPNDAIRAEKQIKGWSRKKKQALARGDWGEMRRLSKPYRG